MDSVGNKVRETQKDGQLLSTTIEKIGESAKLWAEIEAEQKAAQKEESELWRQITAEEKQARDEEKQMMRELVAEQEAYITALKNREEAEQAALDDRNRNQSLQEYASLFDEISQKEDMHRQVLADLAEEEENVKKKREEDAKALDELAAKEQAALDERNRRQAEADYAALFDQEGLDAYLTSLNRQIALTKILYSLKTQSGKDSKSTAEDIASVQQALSKQEQISKTLTQQNVALKSNAQANELIKRLAEMRKDGEEKVKQAIKDQAEQYKAVQTFLDQIVRSITHLGTTFVFDKIRQAWSEMITYAQEYYDMLNEIRIITGMSEEKAASLGSTYRNMAKEMSVSSTEMTEAAVTFWRQGLDEGEVNER